MTYRLDISVPTASFRRLLPGLVLTFCLAATATIGWRLLGQPALLGPLVLAMLGGIILGNAGLVGAEFTPGARFAMRPVLRAGIVLLGFNLTLADLGGLGLGGLAMIVALVATTFLAVRWMGRLLGVSPQLRELIAAGTAICGASAVLGVNTVTKARDEDVAYAVACVTIFGSIAMVLYPVLQGMLGFDEHAYGLWAGSSLHEVAQAVGAGFSVSDTAGETATVAKLGRVILLAPLILGLGFARSIGKGGEATVQVIPWFVFGFLLAVVLNSVLPLPEDLISAFRQASSFMLAMALCAMGLETRVRRLFAEGLRPLVLGLFGSLLISALAAAMVAFLV
ncbi:MAG: YeiH family putative sulfate export transporter [Rhodobacteraceae bacterium]|jgi:uncharacterized integral membrane protein (TIGR00698 family)|nr:YeiH family putative sulfate export transporter [Paracoccaceae bacterium]